MHQLDRGSLANAILHPVEHFSVGTGASKDVVYLAQVLVQGSTGRKGTKMPRHQNFLTQNIHQAQHQEYREIVGWAVDHSCKIHKQKEPKTLVGGATFVQPNRDSQQEGEAQRRNRGTQINRTGKLLNGPICHLRIQPHPEVYSRRLSTARPRPGSGTAAPNSPTFAPILGGGKQLWIPPTRGPRGKKSKPLSTVCSH